MFPRVATFATDHPGNLFSTPLAIITVDVDGNYYTFSPEIAGLNNKVFSIGNISTGGLKAALTGTVFREMSASVSSGIERCRSTCTYFTVCGGGSPSNKFAENGTFDCTTTQHCNMNVKVLADVLKNAAARNLEAM